MVIFARDQVVKEASILSSSARRDWEQLQIKRTVPKRKLIFQEGAPVQDVFFLRKGVVKLFTNLPNGQNQIFEILGPGNFLNLNTAVLCNLHDCSCQSLDECHLEILNGKDFFRLLRGHPDLTIQLTAYLAKQLGNCRRSLSDLCGRPTRERLAATIIWLAKEYGHATETGLEIDLPISRREIAKITGITTETAIRQLSALQKEGLIRSIRRKIILTDIKRLSQLAGGSEQYAV